MDKKQKARDLLRDFKGDNYAFGLGVLTKTGVFARELGNKALLIANPSGWLQPHLDSVIDSLQENGVEVAGGKPIPGAKPNSPREDVFRISDEILRLKPDCLVAVGGGSTIDAVKGANILASLKEYDSDLESYFGVGEVTHALEKSGKKLLPMVAVQTAASSAAHLTKYSNITDMKTGQKKLIVDEAIVPERAVFDYSIGSTMPPSLIADGAFDGLAHCLEVFYGAKGDNFQQLKEICLLGIELIVKNLNTLMENPNNDEAREAVGLATDLGGYAIMVGGTNGAHLTSFSLVDVTSHGRACAVMNPYYTVFYAPAIRPQLEFLAEVFGEAGLMPPASKDIGVRELGEKVAEALRELARRVDYPTTLKELPGFDEEHIERALRAAKNPQLEMKLKNMPVPLTSQQVDEYMKPVLEAAKNGNFDLIKNL